MKSLRARLLIAATLVLAGFLAFCGLALERAFRDAADLAERDKLQGLVYALLGAAELSPRGTLFVADADLPDPRLRQPQSSLAATILDHDGRPVWRSLSLVEDLPLPPPQKVGDWFFGPTAPGAAAADDRSPRGTNGFLAAFGMRWLGLDARARQFTIVVYENAQNYRAQLHAFRSTLWLWLGITAAGLLVAQVLVLAWGLAPVRRLAGEIHAIEAGDQNELKGPYPEELRRLTRALNQMIASDRRHLERYRNALGDLAHSLKTPLAVLQGIAEEPQCPAEFSERLGDQVERMQQITGHQLRKAATAGRRMLSEPVFLRRVAEKIAGALAKVYAGKQAVFDLEIASGMRIRMDEGDLYELLGNLLDNAAKWCQRRVRAAAAVMDDRVTLRIEDDGTGFPERPEALLERGVRADTQVPGQGLGLAAVRDIVALYDGTLSLGRSELGGARVEVVLPRGFEP